MKKQSKMNYAVKVNGKTVGYVIRTRLGWRPAWGYTRTPLGGSYATPYEAEQIVIAAAGSI